jgi:putative spermidine/putrescine transport system permease protein
LVVAYLLLFYLYPLWSILSRSVTDPVFGFGNYVKAFNSEAFRRVGWQSLRIAVLAAIGTLSLGYPYAYAMSRAGHKTRTILFGIILLSFWVSVLVRSFSWFVLLGRNGAVNLLARVLGFGQFALVFNLTGVLIGMIHILLPFMVLPLWANMVRIDPVYERAALSLGASRWRAWLEVFLPLSMPGVVSGWLIVLITALGFYVTPALLGGRTERMIAMIIYERINLTLEWGLAGAFATVLMVVTTLLYFIQRRASHGGMVSFR